MVSKPRVIWIDMARAITMLCVVIGHIIPAGDIRTILYGFHVPAFFFLSGIFFSCDDNFGKFFFRRFRNILIPYFCFGFVAIIAYQIFGNLIYSKDLRSIADCMYGLLIGSVKTGCMHFNYHLWFLPALFSMNFILYPFFRLIQHVSYRKNIDIRILSSVLTVFFFIISQLIFTFKVTSFLPLSADTAVRLIPFFVAGKTASYFDGFLNHVPFKPTKRLFYAISSLFFLFISAATSKYNEMLTFDSFHINYMRDAYGNRILFQMSAIFGIIFIVLFAKLIPSCTPIIYTGQKSLSILVMQKFPIMIFNSVLPFTARLIEESNLFAVIILSIVTIILCLVANIFVENLIPFMYGKKRNRNIFSKTKDT